jgi:hypothetical protein
MNASDMADEILGQFNPEDVIARAKQALQGLAGREESVNMWGVAVESLAIAALASTIKACVDLRRSGAPAQAEATIKVFTFLAQNVQVQIRRSSVWRAY